MRVADDSSYAILVEVNFLKLISRTRTKGFIAFRKQSCWRCFARKKRMLAGLLAGEIGQAREAFGTKNRWEYFSFRRGCHYRGRISGCLPFTRNGKSLCWLQLEGGSAELA